MAPSDPTANAITISRDQGVATITMNRPEARNALTPELFARLGQLFDEVAGNPDDRVLILTGVGDAFSAGADLTGGGESVARLARGYLARAQFAREAIAPALALHRVAKPTIAAVNGVAAGGGCNLALGCDIVFAAESARFVEVFVDRALALDYGGTWLLPRLVGLQRAKDLAFRGDPISAPEAQAMGLVLEVVPDAAILAHATAYARRLAAKPPIALSLIKSGINRATTQGFEDMLEFEADAQAACLGSDDFREAMLAWHQKRDGEYRGD
jgi:2-(1,2-epoxy-1,2-dihydrophenyl)acetyl-CoA isomerase